MCMATCWWRTLQVASVFRQICRCTLGKCSPCALEAVFGWSRLFWWGGRGSIWTSSVARSDRACWCALHFSFQASDRKTVAMILHNCARWPCNVANALVGHWTVLLQGLPKKSSSPTKPAAHADVALFRCLGGVAMQPPEHNGLRRMFSQTIPAAWLILRGSPQKNQCNCARSRATLDQHRFI